ncbi:MAG: HAMP domain-containing sensor histidine kinase, partial [Methylococcales bacterium]
RYKTNIMATVSHEMKNPLHSILFAIELLFEAVPEQQGKYATYCEHYQRSKILVKDLVRSIDAILFNAKLSASEYKKNYTRFLIVDLMNECLHNNQVLCQKNQNTISTEGDKTLWVQSDRQLLRYIVDNLLNNAGKFTQGGKIALRWNQLQNGGLTIEVQDTGCGMSQQDIEIIFEEFRQIDMSLTRKYQGFGLGLAIVKQSAQLLDGHIGVDSAFGKGTLFKVNLPNHLQVSETVHNAA